MPKPTTAELRIEASSEQTKIEFSDNGIGFNLMEVKRGNGLINIQERCKIIEANLDFSSNEAMGTKICNYTYPSVKIYGKDQNCGG
jgi:signal transduction histidine kinase